MDLVAEMLASHLTAEHGDEFAIELVRPRFVGFKHNRESAVGKQLFNALRVLNRFAVYPRWITRHRERFDLFHILDHSYGHLVHGLPSERCVVTCHDLDTFQCLLSTEARRRSPAFRAMTIRILAGFRRAGRVICVTESTRNEVMRRALISADRLVVIHNGVAPDFAQKPDPMADAQFAGLLEKQRRGESYLLHVGSAEPRKRIDLLLRIFGAVAKTMPTVGLVRVGGALGERERRLAAELGVANRILEMPFIERRLLAAAYRGAAALVLPSQAEGFGLPVIEAMACGTRVIASDIPAFREIGGSAAKYCPLEDMPAWKHAIIDAIRAPL